MKGCEKNFNTFNFIFLSFEFKFYKSFCQTQNNELTNSPELSAMSAILVDFDTGRVLLRKTLMKNFPSFNYKDNDNDFDM